MALTELQLPTKSNFYSHIQNAASHMDKLIQTWENLAEVIGFIEPGDLDSMNVPSGQIRTDLVDFRTVLNEMIAFYRGTSTTQTEIPSAVIDKIRSM